MKRLSDIPKKVNDILQCVGARFADIVIRKTPSKNLRVVVNRCNDASRWRWTIAIEIHWTTAWGTKPLELSVYGRQLIFCINKVPAFSRMASGLVCPICCAAYGSMITRLTSENVLDAIFLRPLGHHKKRNYGFRKKIPFGKITYGWVNISSPSSDELR